MLKLLNKEICKKCGICRNQKIILDKVRRVDVMWIGISAQKIKSDVDIPLNATSSTGKIIKEIEDGLPEVRFYKTNLVKCLPLGNSKLRYPTAEEKENCFKYLLQEIEETKPRVTFLLGNIVSEFVFKNLKLGSIKLEEDFKYKSLVYDGIKIIPIHHPSHMRIFKSRLLNKYIAQVSILIKSSL